MYERNPDAEIRFVDSLRSPAREHQEALGQLLKKVDVPVVVGGRPSNNSGQLVESAGVRGVTASLAHSAKDVDDAWCDGKEIVGLTTGTSTPRELIDEVQRALESRYIAHSDGSEGAHFNRWVILDSVLEFSRRGSGPVDRPLHGGWIPVDG